MGTLNRKIARRYGKAIDLDNFKADGSLATGAPEIYDSADLLPTSGVAVGTQAYVTANQKLYIRATGGWDNVATVNTTPTINSVADAGGDSSPFDLAKDGSTTTVITITATDSEGFPVTFSAVANSGFNGLATVAQDSSVFTITPKTEAAATTTEGTLTFRASDGVNIASEIATFTLTFQIADSRFTTTLIKASGNNGVNTTINDASSGNNTITVTGNAVAQAHTPYHPAGYSFQVKGNSDGIAIDSGYFTSNSTWWTSSGFTMEGWINLSATNNTAIWDNRSSGSSGWMLNYNNTAGKISIYTGSFQAFDTTITKDAWHYIALTVSGTSANLYVDGLKDPTTCTVGNTASFAYFGKSQNTLGAVQYTPRASNACQGFYRDFKFTAGVQYTGSTMTVPTGRLSSDSDTALFVTMSPNLKDISSNASTVTSYGSTFEFNTIGPYNFASYAAASHGASVYFDGTDDALRTADHTSLSLGTSDFTVEAWIKPSNTSTAYRALVSDNAYGQNSGSWCIYQYGTKLYIASNTGSGGNAISTLGGSGNTVIKANEWQHIAFTRSSNTARLFHNGVQIGSDTTLSTNFTDDQILIGANNHAGGYPAYDYIGYISDVRVVKGSAVYTSAFTPPTLPLTAITYTSLLTCNDTPNIYDADGSRAEIVLVGDAKSSTAQTKYASASMYFDGTGDAVRVGSTEGTGTSYDLDQFAFSDEPFSIEFWMRPSIVTKQAVVSWIKYNGSGGRNTPHFYFENDGTLKYWRNASIIASTSALSTNTWYHVSYNRFGGRDAFYLNGTVAGNSTIGNTAYEQGRMSIGQYYTTTNTLYNTQPFNGYLEDIRVTKGKIRNVMPTAETFTADSNTTFLTAHTSTITDGSSNNHTITTTGSPTVSNFGPAPGMKSIYFDGVNDYLNMGTGLFANTDFTIEFWFYPPEDGDGYTTSDNITSANHTFTDSRGGVRLQLWYNITSGSSAANASTGGYTSNYYGNAGSLYYPDVERRWTHFAYQRSSGTLRCYVNGIDQGWTQSITADPSNNTTYIGARHDNQATRLKGYISNYRISNVARYTGNFTPPTTELEA